MHHVRQENLSFVGSSHEFVGAEQGTPVFRYSCSMANPVRDRTGSLMTRFSSSAKGEECGR